MKQKNENHPEFIRYPMNYIFSDNVLKSMLEYHNVTKEDLIYDLEKNQLLTIMSLDDLNAYEFCYKNNSFMQNKDFLLEHLKICEHHNVKNIKEFITLKIKELS